jgi:hypothetical protein
MLHKLSKDLLVKLVETIQKDYSTYLVLRYEGYGEVSVDTFDNEESVKEYLIDILYMKKIYKDEEDKWKVLEEDEETFAINKHRIIESLRKYTLEQLLKELSEFEINFKVMKGKLYEKLIS